MCGIRLTTEWIHESAGPCTSFKASLYKNGTQNSGCSFDPLFWKNPTSASFPPCITASDSVPARSSLAERRKQEAGLNDTERDELNRRLAASMQSHPSNFSFVCSPSPPLECFQAILRYYQFDGFCLRSSAVVALIFSSISPISGFD